MFGPAEEPRGWKLPLCPNKKRVTKFEPTRDGEGGKKLSQEVLSGVDGEGCLEGQFVSMNTSRNCLALVWLDLKGTQPTP